MDQNNYPSSAEVEQELQRQQYQSRFRKTLLSTLFILITAAAVAVLVASLWLPVLQIFSSSMTPTLAEGQIVVSVKDTTPQTGDIIAFYHGNKVLVKRCIAGPGSWVELTADGTVIVDGKVLQEPYLETRDYGICDLEFPFQVPEGTYFLLGDHRETSVDSRHSSIGCISQENIVGKIVYRVWPLRVFGTVE